MPAPQVRIGGVFERAGRVRHRRDARQGGCRWSRPRRSRRPTSRPSGSVNGREPSQAVVIVLRVLAFSRTMLALSVLVFPRVPTPLNGVIPVQLSQVLYPPISSTCRLAPLRLDLKQFQKPLLFLALFESYSHQGPFWSITRPFLMYTGFAQFGCRRTEPSSRLFPFP